MTHTSAVPVVRSPERLHTVANVVTLFRAGVASTLFIYAFSTHGAGAMWSGLAVFWILDFVDGFTARLLHQETRTGAVLDGQVDRLLVTQFLICYLALHPTKYPAVFVFLIYLFLIEAVLYGQFLRFADLPSPTYFFVVDRYVWLMNWSAAAKFTSSVMLTAAVVLIPDPLLAALVICAVGAIRLHPLTVALRLPPSSAEPSVLS